VGAIKGVGGMNVDNKLLLCVSTKIGEGMGTPTMKWGPEDDHDHGTVIYVA